MWLIIARSQFSWILSREIHVASNCFRSRNHNVNGELGCARAFSFFFFSATALLLNRSSLMVGEGHKCSLERHPHQTMVEAIKVGILLPLKMLLHVCVSRKWRSSIPDWPASAKKAIPCNPIKAEMSFSLDDKRQSYLWKWLHDSHLPSWYFGAHKHGVRFKVSTSGPSFPVSTFLVLYKQKDEKEAERNVEYMHSCPCKQMGRNDRFLMDEIEPNKYTLPAHTWN